MTRPAKRKLTALAIDLLYIALLCVGASRTPYSKTADLAMVAFYLALMAVLSLHRVRDWTSGLSRENPNKFLRRYWRWVTDDYPESK